MIYADLHKADDKGRLILTCLGTLEDLSKNNLVLKDGLDLLFYMDDGDADGNEDNLVFKGIVERDKDNDRWVANIDWIKVNNLSKLSQAEKAHLGLG